MEAKRHNFAMGLAAALLLLSAHANAQVRSAVRNAPFPGQQSSQAIRYQAPSRYQAFSNVYPDQTGTRYTAQSQPAQSVRYPAVNGAQGLSYNAPNGYAVPAPIVANAPNGYAVPAPVPTVDPYVLCDAKWNAGLRREALNADNWVCATRVAPDGSVQNCVLTGSTPTSVFKNVSTCGWKMPVFCDNTVADLMASQPKSAIKEDSTPAGYTLLAGAGYYKLHPELLTWDKAEAVCEAEVPGGHLAVLVTASLYQTFYDMLMQALPGHVNGAFVGINDFAVSFTFVAVTGQPICMLGKDVYAIGQPNNVGGIQRCDVLGSGGIVDLNDLECADQRPFFCEVYPPSMLAPCFT